MTLPEGRCPALSFCLKRKWRIGAAWSDASDRDDRELLRSVGAGGHSGGMSPESLEQPPVTPRWVAPSQADAVRRDAIAIATFAVNAPNIREVTKRELLSKYVLVLLTHGTANGKYGTRYRSTGALDIADPATLEHEHVFPRKWLIEQMMESPEAVEMVLTHFAIACTVTSDEHRRLAYAERANPALAGWERYHAAGIEVIDTATGAVVPQSIGERPPLPHEQAGGIAKR